MALFVISDLHLSLSSDKPMDIFKGWSDYVSRIEKNWRAVVNTEDTVVIPGDISWEMKIENALADFSFIDSLPGKKLILKGNHDLWWSTVSKMKSFLINNGIDSIDFVNNNAFRVGEYAVCGSRGWMIEESGTDSKLINREAMRLETSILAGEKLGGKIVVFLHYPVVYDGNQVCTELLNVLKKHNVSQVYYGHIHGTSAYRALNGKYDGIEFRLVSCDYLNFCPILVG